MTTTAYSKELSFEAVRKHFENLTDGTGIYAEDKRLRTIKYQVYAR